MGKYVNDNLLTNEQVVFETHYHWVHFISWRSLFTLGVSPLLDYYYSEFVVTNKRIIIKKGFLSRNIIEMILRKIETVNVNQSILGVLLGYGQIRIIGTGGTNEIIYCIAKPMEFRKMFMELSAT